MSNNGIPPLNDWQSDNYPVIYDEGDATLKYVKTGNKVDINTGGSSYLVYAALLSQSGTDAPTVTELQNTVGEITWTRFGVGIYRGTKVGAFTSGKTVSIPFGQTDFGIFQMGIGSSLPFDYAYSVFVPNEDYIQLNCYQTSDYSDHELSDLTNQSQKIFIEIRVYP